MINRILTGLMLSFFCLHLQAAPVYSGQGIVTLVDNSTTVVTATDGNGVPVSLSESYYGLPGDASNYLSGSASLTQSAPIGSSVLTGSLSSGALGIGFTPFYTATSHASIDYNISLDSTYDYVFEHSVSDWFDVLGTQMVNFSLLNVDTNNVIFDYSASGTYSASWFTGSLAAGNYQLFVQSTSHIDDFFFEGHAISAFELTLTPTAVPVPAAAWLFCSGLLGLVGAARHKAA